MEGRLLFSKLATEVFPKLDEVVAAVEKFKATPDAFPMQEAFVEPTGGLRALCVCARGRASVSLVFSLRVRRWLASGQRLFTMPHADEVFSDDE